MIAFAIFTGLLACVSAFQYVHMERGNVELREDFSRLGEANSARFHEVVFAVRQKNADALEKLFYEVSDPKSSKYGQYLNRRQVADLTANPEATEFVRKFLQDQGATVVKTTPYGEYITAMASVQTWSKMFATTFYEFQHENKNTKPVVRCTHYSLPQELSAHVESVFNTVQLPPRQALRSFAVLKDKNNATLPSDSITPALLNSYYDITSNIGNSLASQSLFESLGQYYSEADLTLFEKNYGIPQQSVAYDIGGYESDSECVDNPNNCAEANLDVQYIIAVSQVTPTTYWYEDSTDSFLAWIKAVASTENPPLVHSMSYGSIETELPASIANSFNTEAKKLGVQGVTIVISSGDDGVANFGARTNPKQCGYNPSFPASSPYVTAIGATQGPESGKTEVACTSDNGGVITTGGGFSSIFTAPSYQKSAISGYFKGLSASQQPVSGYNAAGRGYPDLAMAGLNYEVVIGGATYKVSGTSASAPVVAGMISLVNAARLAAGKPALGFINQAIYQAGLSVVNDITSGENNCAASKVCCTQGFYATAGWDPLTGFGSVNYKKFYDVFFNL
jgi:tripeptidyl-peptidase-1